MKKIILIILVAIILMFNSCILFNINQNYDLTVIALSSRAGSYIEDVEIEVFYNGNKITKTSKNGKAGFNFDFENDYINVDIKMTKKGHSYNKVKNLIVYKNKNNIYEGIMHNSQIIHTPDESFPQIILNLEENINEYSLVLPDTQINYELFVDINNTQFNTKIIYVKFGKLSPGAAFFDEDRDFFENSNYVTGNINTGIYEGIVPLHVVVYDENNSRVHYMYHLNVSDKPIISNIRAVTRKKELSFYSVQERPQNINIWVEIEWENKLDVDGFAIYRSFDGERYVEIERVTQPFFKDSSSLLLPGKEVFYKIGNINGNKIINFSNVKSVIPLNTFEIIHGVYDGKLKSDYITTDVNSKPWFFFKPVGKIGADNVTYKYIPLLKDSITNDGYKLIPVFKSGFMYSRVAYSLFVEKDGKNVVSIYDYSSKTGYGYKDMKSGDILSTPYELEKGNSYEYGFAAIWAESENAISIYCDEYEIVDPFGNLYFNDFKIFVVM